MTTEQKKPVLCAGQECPERSQCTRYRMRYARAAWASFDIERAAMGDTRCPAKLQAHREAIRER